MADIREDDNLFGVATSLSAVGATQLPFFLIKNPSGSGVTVKLRKLIYSNSHTVAGSWIRFRVYMNPTITSDGTALSEIALDVGSGKTASATTFLSPTISANGSLVLDLMCLAGQQSELDASDGVQLRANNSMLVTVVADGTSRIANLSCVWEED